MTNASQAQYRAPRLPVGVPYSEEAGQLRLRVLDPFRRFPRNVAHYLNLGVDPSLARKRRRGERPVTLAVLLEWLSVCAKHHLVEIGMESLQVLADVIGCDVVRRSDGPTKSPALEVAAVTRAAGNAIGEAIEDLADGRIDREEAKRLLPVFLKLRELLDRAIESLRRAVR